MPSKTDDIEFAIRYALPAEPVTVAEAEELLYNGYPVLRDEDRRWIGVAMHNLERDGKIRYTGCTHEMHEGDCKVELIR
jgi:hypothetical protein